MNYGKCKCGDYYIEVSYTWMSGNQSRNGCIVACPSCKRVPVFEYVTKADWEWMKSVIEYFGFKRFFECLGGQVVAYKDSFERAVKSDYESQLVTEEELEYDAYYEEEEDVVFA